MVFTKELKKLGLKDKEAAVYIACLELGPSPVQIISRKANVVRATTYVVLDALAKRGLVTQYKEGKKTLFSAEPPRQLVRLLEKQEEVITEKKHDLDQLLPQLQALMKGADERPTARYFEGREGLQAIRQEIIMQSKPGDTIYSFTPADHLVAVFPDEEDTNLAQRRAKGIHAKILFTTRSKALEKHWLEIQKNDKYSKRRFVAAENLPITGGATIYGDRIALGSFSGKLVGVVIENSAIANMMRSLFELAWETASQEPLTK